MKTKSAIVSRILKITLCMLAVFLLFWFTLPPLHPLCTAFWWFVFKGILICLAINLFSFVVAYFRDNTEEGKFHPVKPDFDGVGKVVKYSFFTLIGVIVIIAVGSLIGAQLFNAGSYNELIKFEDGDFITDVSEISEEQIPVVDKDTAARLGKRKLGEMSDLVSQFEIMDVYTQINYKGRPVRVTPLIYGDFIKWFNNQSEGVPAYIMVDMTTQKTTLVRLEKGMMYSTDEYFMRNVERYLRFKYPTKIFDNISFEIDDNGVPYWVVSTVKYRVGLWSGKDIGGAILLNAVTGDAKYYDLKDVPKWVDQVFDSDMVLTQLEYNGKYRSGFFNSIFGQKGVLLPTDGHNYLAIDDDVYLYTGMTSATSDESNVGFVLTNLRTKETKYYKIPGAEEYSAMESAEGQVQHLSYEATFPLLLNVSDRPTYFMSLKDSAGLVKMYAFVDVQQYQIVGTGDTVDEARADYISKLDDEKVVVEETKENKVSGVIERISSAVVEGNTNYFITLVGDDRVYIVPVSFDDRLPFAAQGDKIVMNFSVGKNSEKLTAVKISLVGPEQSAAENEAAPEDTVQKNENDTLTDSAEQTTE